MAYNIKQITNFSKEVKNANVDENGYITLEIPNIVKFGYICENRGIGLPIYISNTPFDNNGNAKPNELNFQKIEIGKTGMYEASDVLINGIKIPCGEEKDFNFTFDYVIYNAD